jgi:hypothetical protein
MVRYWQTSAAEWQAAERVVLAPARRRSGLAVNDAQETLDRLLLEPNLAWRRGEGAGSAWESGLTFVTYLQRFARAVTTLAVVGTASEPAVGRVRMIAGRLHELSRLMVANEPVKTSDEQEPAAGGAMLDSDIAEQQLRRMERQVGVMERAAKSLQEKSGTRS